nr:hypothetical protein [Micromonospora sp. DSM 115978]
MRKIRTAAVATLAGLALASSALAGCGASGDSPDQPGGTDQPGGNVTSTAGPSGPSEPAAIPPTGPGEPSVAPPPARPGRTLTPGPPGAVQPTGTITISGTIVEGVEVGCVLIDDYLLVGGDKALLRPGARVTVTGEIRSDLMTTCQQGTPLLVLSAKRA